MSKKLNHRGIGGGRGDFRYLTQPRGDGTTWYAVAEVPRSLRPTLGKKRLLRSLKTDDVRLARVARWNALDVLKTEIANARNPSGIANDPIMSEALALREELARASAERRDELLYEITDRAEEIDLANGGTRTEYLDHDTFHQEVASQATNFAKLATGQATPLDLYVDRWLASSGYTDRTKADARTAIEQFKAWGSNTARSFFIETVTDSVASDFRDEAFVVAKVHPKTANKKLSLLRQYWEWLDKSFGIRPNPWMRKSLAKPKAHRVAQDGPQGDERPFTDAEVQALLSGNADPDLADIMRIAALSGMRLEEIGQLRVYDCRDGIFSVTRGKTAAAVRTVPIHSALRQLIGKRTKDRKEETFLFPDLPQTGWDENRTMAVSKRFNYYRKRVGVDDSRPGARRSKVNFHSFRRWFATKAEEAGQRENVVAAVMGHSKNVGLTFGHYSKAELIGLKRQCVEAVKLPRKSRQGAP
jgi:integrase